MKIHKLLLEVRKIAFPDGSVGPDPAPAKLTIAWKSVGFSLRSYPDFGRGDAPDVDLVKSKQKGVWSRWARAITRFPDVKVGEPEVEYHDEYDNTWECALQATVTGPDDQLIKLAKLGASRDGESYNAAWWVSDDDGLDVLER